MMVEKLMCLSHYTAIRSGLHCAEKKIGNVNKTQIDRGKLLNY